MPRRWLEQRRRRRNAPNREDALESGGPPQPRSARRAELALRWIADETRALVASGRIPAGVSIELLRCGESTETAAREIERIREALEEVNGDRSFP